MGHRQYGPFPTAVRSWRRPARLLCTGHIDARQHRVPTSARDFDRTVSVTATIGIATFGSVYETQQRELSLPMAVKESRPRLTMGTYSEERLPAMERLAASVKPIKTRSVLRFAPVAEPFTHVRDASTLRAISTQRPACSTAWRAVPGAMSDGSYSAFGLSATSRARSLARATPSAPDFFSNSKAWPWDSPAERWPDRMPDTTSLALMAAWTAELVAAIIRLWPRSSFAEAKNSSALSRYCFA